MIPKDGIFEINNTVGAVNSLNGSVKKVKFAAPHSGQEKIADQVIQGPNEIKHNSAQ